MEQESEMRKKKTKVSLVEKVIDTYQSDFSWGWSERMDNFISSESLKTMDKYPLDCSRGWDLSLGNIRIVESSKSIKDENGPLDFSLGCNEFMDKFISAESSKTNKGDNDGTKDGSGYKSFDNFSLPPSDSEDLTDSNSEETIPREFICALTKQLMSDPVILSSGQTVERRFIETYFDIYPGCRKCPVTRKAVLSSHDLTPDAALGAKIKRWFENKSINDERREYFRMLLRRLAHSSEDQIASAAELRSLVNDFPAYAKVFFDIGSSAVLELARPLLSKEPATIGSLREDIIVTFDLLVEQENEICKLFAHHPAVFDVIDESIRSGSIKTRQSALSLVYYIADFPDGRETLSQRGVVEHLVELVEEGDLLLFNDVLRTLFEFDTHNERVINGILAAFLNHMENENLVSELGWLLTVVMNKKVVWEHVVDSEKIYSKLLDILKEHESDKVKNFCVGFLLRIVRINNRALLSTRKYEDEYSIITRMVETGDLQAKTIAVNVLDLLDSKKRDHTAAAEIHHEELLNCCKIPGVGM
ncbi:unnamed protein product [Rhodiola kirilowii]